MKPSNPNLIVAIKIAKVRALQGLISHRDLGLLKRAVRSHPELAKEIMEILSIIEKGQL